jgi:hypothetical protein
MAFLTRVNMSAMGSVMVIDRTPTKLQISPASFDYPWDFAFQGKLAETDTAELKTTDIASGTTAPLTAIVHPHFVLSTFLPYNHALFGHYPS